MTTWKRYADNRIAYAKTHANHLVLYVLNLFHTKIKFTYEIEDSSEITFLVILEQLYIKNQQTIVCICTGIHFPLNQGNEEHFCVPT